MFYPCFKNYFAAHVLFQKSHFIKNASKIFNRLQRGILKGLYRCCSVTGNHITAHAYFDHDKLSYKLEEFDMLQRMKLAKAT